MEFRGNTDPTSDTAQMSSTSQADTSCGVCLLGKKGKQSDPRHTIKQPRCFCVDTVGTCSERFAGWRGGFLRLHCHFGEYIQAYFSPNRCLQHVESISYHYHNKSILINHHVSTLDAFITNTSAESMGHMRNAAPTEVEC